MNVQLSRKLLASSMPDAKGFILRGIFLLRCGGNCQVFLFCLKTFSYHFNNITVNAERSQELLAIRDCLFADFCMVQMCSSRRVGGLLLKLGIETTRMRSKNGGANYKTCLVYKFSAMGK